MPEVHQRLRAGRASGTAVILSGLLLIQLSWVVAIRPFGGIDEFAHADRAAAVARGQWAPRPSSAVHGSGAWVTVPTNIVQAGQAECQALPYTESAECVGKSANARTTRIATSAGRYNPWFYAVIGYASLPFTGASALLAMRLAAVICCWFMLALACCATRRWARTSWPFVGLALSCTPVILYSSAIAAPNALEICSGIALWSSLLGIFQSDGSATDRLLLSVATVSSAVLVTLRPLGPVWCALIFATSLLGARLSVTEVRRFVASQGVRICGAIVGCATAAGVGWTVMMRTTHLSTSDLPAIPFASQLHLTATQVPLWLLQSIAAFPYRNEPTAPVVYVVYLLLGIALVAIAAGSLRRNRQLMIAVLGSIAVAVVVPATMTLMTFEQYGTSWQGRYGLPYTVGTILLLTWSLDRTDRPVAPTQLLVPALVLYALAHGVSVFETVRREIADDPLHGAGPWLAPSPVLLGATAFAGALLIFIGARRAVSAPSKTREQNRLSLLP